jgi:hypothetical protein
MKYLLGALLFLGASFATYAAEGTKYICSIGGEDEVFTEEFATREECVRLCRPGLGRPAICEETGKKTSVGLNIVD